MIVWFLAFSPSLSNMLCVAHIFIFHINLWQRIWPTSWNIWNYHWGVKPGLNVIIHKWSYTCRSLPQCFGSEIELMLWWNRDIHMCVLSRFSLVQLCNTMDWRLPGSSAWDSPSNYTGVGWHFLLQEIFQTQGSNPHLLHWQADSLPLNYQEIPTNTNFMSILTQFTASAGLSSHWFPTKQYDHTIPKIILSTRL